MEEEPCPLGDQESFCSSMPTSDCYHQHEVCCDTCLLNYTGIEGKFSFRLLYCVFLC